MNSTTLPTTTSSGNLRVISSPTHPDDPYAESERSFEIVKGKLVEKHMGLIENLIASILHLKLGLFCQENQLGRAVMETPFAIPESGNDRKPDVAFVSYQTWAANRQIPRVNAWVVIPDLIVEVISPTDKAFDVIDKVREYFAGGVRQVWHVYSNVEQVLIFDSPSSVRIMNRSDELIGDPVVPGFRMQLVDLFSLAEPNA
jgi:Uma2 family endonuclease